MLLHGPLQALYLHRLRNCHVQAGPVDGATFGEALEGCTVMVAAHQLRLHKSRDTRVYVRPGSDPIIEHCSGMAFAPLESLPFDGWQACLARAELPDSAEGCAWRSVQDFQFPGHQESPNWHVLKAAERIKAQDMSACVLPSGTSALTTA